MIGSKRDNEFSGDALSAASPAREPEKLAQPVPSNVTPLLVEPNWKRPLQHQQDGSRSVEADALAAAAVENRPMPRLSAKGPVAIAEVALAAKAAGLAPARSSSPARPAEGTTAATPIHTFEPLPIAKVTALTPRPPVKTLEPLLTAKLAEAATPAAPTPAAIAKLVESMSPIASPAAKVAGPMQATAPAASVAVPVEAKAEPSPTVARATAMPAASKPDQQVATPSWPTQEKPEAPAAKAVEPAPAARSLEAAPSHKAFEISPPVAKAAESVQAPPAAAAAAPVQAKAAEPMPTARVTEPPPAPMAADTIPNAKVAEPSPTTAKLAEPPPPTAKAPDGAPRVPPIIDIPKGTLRPKDDSAGGGKKGDGTPPNGGGGGGGRNINGFQKRAAMPDFARSFKNGVNAVRFNLSIVMAFTVVTNVLVLAIPIYLFQISDRVLTSRSLDTLVMLTIVVAGAVLMQGAIDAVRRFILMRTAVEVEAQLGAPILSAAARTSLNGTSRDYHVLGDLQQVRSFITSGTLLSMLDAPLAPLFVVAIFLIHPHLGYIVVVAAFALLVVALINQRMTAKHFADSNAFLSRATLHLDSMTRNAQIINALAMIPEAVRIWGKDTANSLKAQVRAQDRNIVLASVSKVLRLLTQVAMLGWGAFLAIEGEMTGGMVIAGSIIAARALTPIEGAIEGWHSFTQFRSSFQRIKQLLQGSPFNFERLLLPEPKGRLDVERVLFVPPPNKKVILNGVSFSLLPGESLAVIGNSGAGKTSLGKMLVGSILPTSGSVRLDLMDLRNWDQRQFGESIGYLPQDVQLFPGTIKANIGRMRDDVSDKDIFEAAVLADVHELIASFSQGYETFVAADGAPLSGGQKQRIALARAFFGNPKLVVLDEPNSNLDSQGEGALAKALLHAKEKNITTVTITQRTALLNVVDKILVLNNGTVSMFGTRQEVLKQIAAGKDSSTQARIESGE